MQAQTDTDYNPGGGGGGGYYGGGNSGFNSGSMFDNNQDDSDDDRRERRKKRRRDRDSDSDSDRSSRRSKRKEKVEEAGGAEGIGARARAQGKSNVVKRSQGEGGAVSGKSSGGGSGALPLAAIKLPPAAKENTVYFTPTRAYVDTGQSFVSSMVFFNELGSRVDQVDLWIHYRPTAMEPQWVDTAPLTRFAPGGLEVRTWPKEGYIRISGALTTPMSDPITMLGDIHWKALAPTRGATVEFRAPQGSTYGLLEAGKNVIKANKIGNENRISQIVRIRKPGESTTEPPTLETAARDAVGALPDFEHDAGDRVRLAITPAKPFVGTGEVSTADVVLINPGEYSFDDLRLRIRYDPNLVTILDADENNYIADGVNIWDGGFHDKFAFDNLFANSVDNQRGIIDYRKGNVGGPIVYPSGIVARIVFRMERQAGAVRFWFESADPLGGNPPTDVTSQGLSLLGQDEKMTADALFGARVNVAPLNLREQSSVPVQIE